MTKHLEDLLNIAPADDDDGDGEDIEIAEPEDFDAEAAKQDVARYQSESDDMDKIDEALPPVEGLDDHDTEMDDLAKKAEGAYDDLMGLGMNVDTKYSGRIFEVAASMLGHSIAAKNSKIDRKLKMVDLQLKKQRQDQAAKGKKEPETMSSDGEVIDRNEFLRELLGKKDRE